MSQVVHTVPMRDIHEHADDGVFCPCLPRVRGNVVIHNSYDGREVGEVCVRALDLLGTALCGHGHTWTQEQRDAYEHARQVLLMHWEIDV